MTGALLFLAFLLWIVVSTGMGSFSGGAWGCLGIIVVMSLATGVLWIIVKIFMALIGDTTYP